MKLWNRIKYRLLLWLLNDICIKSECEQCLLGREVRIAERGDDCYIGFECWENDIFKQARVVWGLEK